MDAVGRRTSNWTCDVQNLNMKIKNFKTKKAVIALSGGIDSAVAAALLKKRGLDVLGVFMKLADLPLFRKSEKRAKRIAKILGMPFLSLDLRKEFKKKIIANFLKEYKNGLTPNPCVVCNKEIKFGLFLKKALELDADFVATGHYACKSELKSQNSKFKTTTQKSKVVYKLLMGKDGEKDQSYFLWKLNQKQLSRILFPIGDYTRGQVENLAKKFKLPVLGIKKSVEICFVPKTIHPVKSRRAGISSKTKLFNGVNNFLAKRIKEKPGRIIDAEGKSIGEHQGLWFYTIGQRKGIGLPGGPYYVLDKDFKKNILIITKNEKDLYKKELTAKNVNWISGEEPRLSLKIKAKIRYRHRAATATITKILNSRFLILKFDKPQRAITPGQSVVFYSPSQVFKKNLGGQGGQELLGGGIIALDARSPTFGQFGRATSSWTSKYDKISLLDVARPNCPSKLSTVLNYERRHFSHFK